MNIYYYATAVNKLKVANASKLDYANSLEGNGIVDIYATWDEFPAFPQVDDVSILSSDLSKGKDWIGTYSKHRNYMLYYSVNVVRN